MSKVDDLCSTHSGAPTPGHKCDTCARMRLEQKIVRRVAKDLLAAGFQISVSDGEEEVVTKSSDFDAILAACFSTDQDIFFMKSGEMVTFVQFIYGNGADVISDYGVSLEPHIEPIQKWLDAMDVYA